MVSRRSLEQLRRIFIKNGYRYLLKSNRIYSLHVEIWILEYNRVSANAACNFFPSLEVQCFIDVETFSRGALEDRLFYRDLLASFVARAINYGFIGQAGR